MPKRSELEGKQEVGMKARLESVYSPHTKSSEPSLIISITEAEPQHVWNLIKELIQIAVNSLAHPTSIFLELERPGSYCEEDLFQDKYSNPNSVDIFDILYFDSLKISWHLF